MGSQDENWDRMLDMAKGIQQEYYELFAEWTEYQEKDYSYLKQNIGFAIYGSPEQEQSSNASNGNNSSVHYDEKNFNNADFTEALIYEPDAQAHIDRLFEKVCEYGKGYSTDNSICYGLIYNVTFRNKNDAGTAPTTNDKKDENVKSDATETKDKDSTEGNDNDDVNIGITPIFKIRNRISGDPVYDPVKKVYIMHETLYMDITGRIYRSWEGYKTNNTLHKCTMVLPTDGFYQPDPAYEITEESSVVWLEVEDSPACSSLSSTLQTMDLASNVTSIASLAVAGASLFTPLGPMVLAAGAVGAGVSSLWSIGRSTSNLLDRRQHEESINPVADRAAFASWLSITGGLAGAASSGGSMLLSRAVQKGSTISTTVRMAYNATLLTNLGVNAIGIGYQAYSMYERYQAGQSIQPLDVLMLSTHMLFFGNAVCNLQFAGELIESTQGKVMDDYKASLRSRRLRKAYNRAKRAAAKGNNDVMSERAEVIRYINTKQQASNFTGMNGVPQGQSVNGKLIINGVTLLDPMKFVLAFIQRGGFQTGNFRDTFQSQGDDLGPSGNSGTDQSENLRKLLSNLLTNLILTEGAPQITNIPAVPDFEDIIREMRYATNAQEILRKIFDVIICLINRCESLADYLVGMTRFIWNYLVSAARDYMQHIGGTTDNRRIYVLFLRICRLLLESMDDVASTLISALHRYLSTLENPSTN